MQKILVIAGPTAVGKTALSIKLAQKFNGEIISGDSMQVYRQLNIGTAKVTEEEKAGIPHYLIDCREIEEAYSVADFQSEAREKITEISAKGKLPILVGGTGLYIQALLYDYDLGGKKEQISDSYIRQKYEDYAEKNGKHKLWQLLEAKDSLAAAKIHENNQRRVIRALEVYEQTGESIYKEDTRQALYDYYLVGLETDRALLYERINQRVEQMMKQGLLTEAKLVFEKRDSQATQGIGYKEFFPYFMNEVSLEEAIEEAKKNSRRYAKRQLTWFKNRMDAHWWNLVEKPEQLSQLEQSVTEWLNK